MRTARQDQQAMFLRNLWKEMDALSSIHRSMNISRIAMKYSAEGYELNEIVELLVSDGFDPHLSHVCVAKIANDDGETDINEPDWGFETEDQRGEIANNFDIGCDCIKAVNEEEAWEKAQTFIDTNCNDQYTITKVYRL